MNKLRTIKIYELKGKIHPIEASIINLLDELEEVQNADYIDYIFYKKDGEVYFYYNIKTNSIRIYTHISERYMFKCSLEETEEILKYLLEKYLKITINYIV